MQPNTHDSIKPSGRGRMRQHLDVLKIFSKLEVYFLFNCIHFPSVSLHGPVRNTSPRSSWLTAFFVWSSDSILFIWTTTHQYLDWIKNVADLEFCIFSFFKLKYLDFPSFIFRNNFKIFGCLFYRG